MPDIVTMAIPAFFLLMGIELLVGRARRRPVFRGPDVVANLSLGTISTLVGALLAAAFVLSYSFVYTHWRITTFAMDNWWSWVLALLAADISYYWFHRAAHRVNVFWASHAPHHSSEDYNLAVALRQGPLEQVFGHPFNLALALLGFPIEAFVLVNGISNLYQFWIHTEHVGKLGPLELIFNTPSHHRVHHACNGRYIDKNYGAILVIWDRLFGTFEAEVETPTYGTVKQVATWNPLRAAVMPFVDIAQIGAEAPRIVDKMRVWLMPPEWLPEGLSRDVAPVEGRAKYDVAPGPAVARYVTVMFVLTIFIGIAYLLNADAMPVTTRCAGALWLALTLTSLGALLDGRPYARGLEVARLVALVPLVPFVALT